MQNSNKYNILWYVWLCINAWLLYHNHIKYNVYRKTTFLCAWEIMCSSTLCIVTYGVIKNLCNTNLCNLCMTCIIHISKSHAEICHFMVNCVTVMSYCSTQLPLTTFYIIIHVHLLFLGMYICWWRVTHVSTSFLVMWFSMLTHCYASLCIIRVNFCG